MRMSRFGGGDLDADEERKRCRVAASFDPAPILQLVERALDESALSVVARFQLMARPQLIISEINVPIKLPCGFFPMASQLLPAQTRHHFAVQQ